MPPERRHALAEICARHGTWIVEDNPYGLLGFDGQPHRAIKADYPDQVIYLGSFSKTVGPGLRIGWIDAPEGIDAILAGAAETGVLNPSTLNQMLLHDYLDGDAWLEALAAARKIYADKAAAMIAGLEQHFPSGATWTTPEGGFYVWVTVPESLDAADLVFEAIEQGVVYIPGNAFYGDGRGRHEMRLSFSLPSIDDINRGVEIIGRVLSQ